MKRMIKLFITTVIILVSLTLKSCDPFDDIYLTLAMDLEFSKTGAGPSIFIVDSLCLSDFEDYEENKEEIEEIRYVTSAYLTIDATIGLRADSLKLNLYQEDGSTELFSYTIQNFSADSTKINPLEIVLTPQEINNINAYLANPQEDKCFVATLSASNVQPNTTQYFLTSKIDFLTELKIKPQ